MSKPRIIEFQHLKGHDGRDINVAQGLDLPFAIKRLFWVYSAPSTEVLGKHAHKELEQVLIAMNGEVQVKTEDINGNVETFTLNSPSQGLYLPPLCWHEISFSENTIMLSITSLEYDESDYIRDYDSFKQLAFSS